MRIRTPAALLLVATLCAACADTPTAGPGGGSSSGLPSPPAGADELVLRMADEGGFVPVDFALASMPSFSLFGDGTAVTAGAQTAIYPGPALPPLVSTALTHEAVDAVVRDALRAGLDEDRDYTDLGSVGVADASTTVFTLTVNGVTHVTKAYALGMADTQQPDRMSDEEFAARGRLADLQAELQDLRGSLPAGSVGANEPYEPTGLRLFVSEYRGDGDLREPAVPWPLETPLTTIGEPASIDGYRCTTVTGDDLSTLLPLAESANQLTPWRSGDERFSILFRPLLPDETGC